MQRLLNGSHWNADDLRDDLRAYVIEHLSEEEAVLVVDETGFLKKGDHSVGVKRQYSGTAGGIENCQVGVFLAYTSPKGTAFIDRELFLPKEWVQDQQRREKAQVPDERVFLSKPQLAHVMLERTLDGGVRAAWVTADSVYAASPLRHMLEARQQAYVIAITSSFLLRFFEEEGLRQARVVELFAELPAGAWQRLSAGQGSKGERLFDWACIRLWDLGERSPDLKRPYQDVGFDKWLLARRSIADPNDLTFYIAFAPETTTLTALVQVAGSRWTIETGFEALKQEAGLDEYETRSWTGWYRHITLSLLAHAFLTVVRHQEVKKGARRASSA
jgi:SRSO17 transposase